MFLAEKLKKKGDKQVKVKIQTQTASSLFLSPAFSQANLSELIFHMLVRWPAQGPSCHISELGPRAQDHAWHRVGSEARLLLSVRLFLCLFFCYC